MKIIIGSDHAGYQLKSEIIEYLKTFTGVEVKDMGTHSNSSVDYPDQALAVAEKVISDTAAINDDSKVLGILICGTGIGIGIAANKVPGIRAANCHNKFTAQMTREHNDANILVLGARVITNEAAKEIVEIFLKTDYAGGRHQQRVQKITDIEAKYSKK